jgi:hypothetical protein
MPQTLRSGTADATGKLTLELRVQGSQAWTISQVSPEMATGSDTATGALRLNGALVSPFVPTADAIGGDPPITILPGADVLTVEWTAAVPGSVGSALFVYQPGG